MGLLSLFRSHPAAPGLTGEPGLRWRKTDLITFSAGDETHIAYARRGTPMSLPAFAMEFVLSCAEFRPLETHLKVYAEQHGFHSLQLESLRQYLPKLIEAGVLVSSAEVRARCAAMPAGETPPPIAAIGFPTGGTRVPLLTRALESFAANLRTHGRTADLIVADSSSEREQLAALRAATSEVGRSFGVRTLYSGTVEKRRFADALIARGCREESVEFALFDPLAIGFTCGANRNALLLHEAGRIFCSVDDDVTCRLAVPPMRRSARLSMFSNTDPFSRWAFPDRESAFAATEFVERDFLAAHETMLGRGLGALFSPALAEHELDLTDTGDDLLRRLELGNARVRTTYLGHVGDPGLPTSCNYLFYEGENLRRLTESEAHYRSVFGSRSVFTSVLAPSIGDASVSPGMAMGLDHRELLPPFFPVLHAEDFAFGTTVWQCCPGAVAGHQPLVVGHEPPLGKPILQPRELGPTNRAVIFEFTFLLWRMIIDFEPAQRADTVTRLMTLGRHLAGFAAQPTEDFLETLRETVLKHESEKLGYLEGSLRNLPDAPEYWREDAEAFLLHTRESLAQEDFDIPYDLKGGRSSAENRRLMQELFARFGQLLQDWPEIVAAARDLRQSGISLAVPV